MRTYLEILSEGTDSLKKMITDGKRMDIQFNGKSSENGWKISIQGKNIEDIFYLVDILYDYLRKNNITFKVATDRRISHPNKEQSKKVMTIYNPDGMDVYDLAEKLYKLTKKYKGWYNIKTPTSYEHYAGGLYIRNDRTDSGRYIPAN